MNKPANKISKKIFNDVDAVYSYILSSDEIKKLSNDIVKLLRVDHKKRKKDINEEDVLLITYADTINSQNKKPLVALNEFLKIYIKNSINIIYILPFYPQAQMVVLQLMILI